MIETDSVKAEEALTALPTVETVQTKQLDATWYRVTVTPRNEDQDLREQLSRALAEVQSITRELHRQTPTLEHLFVQMVADAEVSDEKVVATGGETAP